MKVCSRAAAVAVAIYGLILAWGVVAASDDGHAGHHGHHGHAAHDTARDAEGRRLFGQPHQMPPEMYDELREKVALYRDYSNAEIDLSMEMMGPEYQWYISPEELRGEDGVIIIMHGFREHGDRAFRQRMQPIADRLPTALAIGMSMMMSEHVQLAIDDLQAAGARRIVVLPVVSSADNAMYRQWRYIFGLHDVAEYGTVPVVRTDPGEVIFVEPPEDHPLVAEILLDHAREISEDPGNEVVIIASHGPTSAADNELALAMLGRLAAAVHEQGGFADVIGLTLQDDAPPAVRARNVEKLRAAVQAADAAGHDVLVITNLIGTRTIQGKLRSDLAGLEYRFNPAGIVQHDNFIRWMDETLTTVLAE